MSQPTLQEIREKSWPEIFMTGKLPHVYIEMLKMELSNHADKGKAEMRRQVNYLLCMDGMLAWTKCAFGCEPPKKFGDGMVVIGTEIGVPATRDSLMKWLTKQVHEVKQASI